MSTDTPTLDAIGRGIMERIRSIRRVRVGCAVFDQLYRDLCAREYEVEKEDGSKVYMWMRWTNPRLHVPHFLVFNTPVELDVDIEDESIGYDGPESM